MPQQRKDYEAGDAARERDYIFTGSSNDASSAASETSFNCLESCGNFHILTLNPLANAMDIKREVQRRGEAHLDRVKELATDIKATQGRIMLALEAELGEESKELRRELDAGREALERTGNHLCNLKLEVIERESMRGLQVFKATVQRSSLPRHHFTARQHIRVLRDMDEQEAMKEVVLSRADLVEDLGREPAPAAQGLVGPTELLPTAAIWTSSTQPSTTTPPVAPPNCASQWPDSAYHKSLSNIKLPDVFPAMIDYVADDHIRITTRSTDAWKAVEGREGQHCWAMCESKFNTGYQRMTTAATALDQFLNRTPDGRVSDDELRIRQILVGNQGGQLGGQERAAASCVSWMTPEAQAALRAALDRDTVLNDAQRNNLKQAAARSLTLMQGPPGTGKSATLISMVKALCRVFHRPTNLTGQWCPNATKAKLHGLIAGHLKGDSELRHDAAMGAAEPCAAVLLAALDELKSNPPNPYQTARKQNMRIMVAAESDAAVDRLLAGLVDDPNFTGYTIVRMGPSYKVTAPRLAQYSLDGQKAAHKLVVAVKQLKKALTASDISRAEQGKAADTMCRTLQWVARKNELEATKPHINDALRKQLLGLAELSNLLAVNEVTQMARQFQAAKAAMKCTEKLKRWLHAVVRSTEELAGYDIVIRAHVVVGTCVDLGELRNSRHRALTLVCPIVLCDEAAQSSECASMVPLTLGAEWVLMAGDTKQLCPVLKSSAARTALRLYSSGGSLYGRLQAAGVMERTLVMQYRMHPVLREFPSDTFYGGRLEEDPQHMPCMDLPNSGGMVWPRPGYPVAFFDTNGRSEHVSLTARGRQSWRNEEEASVALRLMLLVGSDPAVASIAILTPYMAQCSTINSLLEGKKAQELFAQYRARGIFYASACRAYTIDGYQGQEADVVILTTVQIGGALGHVADPRRLNVAITRARRGLLIVGCAAALRSEVNVCMGQQGEVYLGKQNYRTVNYWPRFIDHIKANGGFVEKDQVQDKLKSHITLPMCLCTLDEDKRLAQQVSD